MKNKFVASALGFIGLCSLAACSASSDAGSSVAKTERVASSQSQALTIENGECSERAYTLPAPQPIFQAADTYETVVAESNDPAVVFSPSLPTFLKGKIQFPVVVVLQGGSVANTAYTEFSQRLARYGYIVIVPNHVTTIGVQTGVFTNVRVLTQSFDHLKAESARTDSPIKGFVDGTKLAVVGHSLGGAQALFATGNVCAAPFCFGPYARPAELKATVTYGGNTKARPPATGFQDIDSTGVATLMINGGQDSIALIESGRGTWDLLEGPKAFFRINGATHYGINNEHNMGVQLEPPPALDQAAGLDAIAGSTALWLGIHVQGNGLLGGSLSCFSGTSDGNVTFEN